jgi:hypothetical protein
VHRLTVIFIATILLAVLVLSGLSDTAISVSDVAFLIIRQPAMYAKQFLSKCYYYNYDVYFT